MRTEDYERLRKYHATTPEERIDAVCAPNERAHREGKPHLRKLFGMVLCRLCKEAI